MDKEKKLHNWLRATMLFAFITLASCYNPAIAATTVMVDGIRYSIEGNEATVIDNGKQPGQYRDEVNIPDCITIDGSTYTVTAIGDEAFVRCFYLTRLSLPATIRTIGSRAFVSCYRLAEITVPQSVTRIGDEAFNNCSLLTSMTIPAAVTSIGTNLFSGCDNLTTISIDPHNTCYDSRQDCNAIIETATGKMIAACYTTTFPEGVTAIADRVFYQMERLKEVVLPNSLRRVPLPSATV